ncbi:hypothetical protein TTHERM_00684610 (macronuclear) [Tetrahymena thermophila SB210]|uniref:Uncharacterized protein n=1 Tax=Tetrahymena thermophila (strain SB210) TaxID=312017 RepID=I7MJ07_TETTS|nr:hypothetical protein TTHERM_00684610 [Tetrahymena thermophila SB210]EAS04917.2 hypothetical protein TTHERM_00684610 [Tetrahymena thermophila SB210]|eukprot:XP_001025162.2 hypothetical protein TTHERM_00684610 [Tetrahymena thermophila SB210]
MNNQINYQQIHNFHLNLQGIQPQKIPGQIQVLSPKSNYASPPQYLIQSINHTGIQINQGIENSPSNRFLSNTAKVLKSQTIDFKQMMVKQHQQSLANHNYANRQIIEVKKNQNEVVSFQPQKYQTLQKPATPTAISSSPSQGFAQTYQNYQRSNSANYAAQQNGVQYDQRVQQPIFIKFISNDNAQNNPIEQNAQPNPVQSSNLSSLPLSPTQIKQKQKCMTYIIQQNNQPQTFGYIERRRSVEEKGNAQDIQKAIIRYSDSFRHKFSDSIQSNNTTANPITTAVSVKSNYSPLQQFDSIDNNKNTQNNLINNSLQLEGSEQNNQNIQFIQEQQIAKNSFRSIQQTSNNEEIVAIDDYQIYSSRNSEEGSKSQRIHETSQQDLNKNISKIMNIYYFKNQSDVIDNQRSNHEQEVVQNPQINQGSESSKLLKNNSLNDSRIKAQKEYSTITEEAKNQVSLSQKSSPQSQAQQIKGTLNQNTSKNSQVQKSRKSLSSVYQSKSKINQIADDKLGLISSSAHKNNNKTNLQSQKSDSKTNSHHQKSQKSIQHHQSNEKIVNSQKLLKQNSRSSSTQIINGASQSQKHFQLYDNDSDNKKPSQKTQQLSDNQKLKQNQSNSQKNSTQKMQTQQQNNSSQRQITFPESPISVTNQIDSSCGFGSEITYTEDQINELSNRVLMMKGNNPIPLIVNHNQICYDLSQQTSKNKPSSFSENIQNKDQQNHLVNEKNFKKKEQTKASPYNLQQKIDYQNYIEDVVFSNKIEQKLLLEKNNTEENKQQKNSAQYDEDDDCEANPDFINLYKTPAKPNSCSLKEAQYTNQIQNLKDKSYSAGQVLDLRKNSSQNEQQQQEQNNQEKQINTEASKNSNNKNVIQNKMQDQENKDKIQIEGKSLSDKIQQVDDKQKIENLREFDNNNGDESPFIVEMKKQHQKIIEEFSIKPIFALDSKEDLNKFSKESSQNSSDAKYSHVSKSDIKKHKRDIESVQSINELLNFMGGIQQSSNTDFIVPGSSVSKQNLSQIFDENSNLPSNVCSLQIIQEQQMTEQVKNSQKQQIQNKQIKDLKVNQKGTNQTNQLNSKHMSHIQTKLTAQQKNFIAVQQKQQKKSQTTYKRQDSPNQVVIQLKGSNSQTQGIKIQDLYIGQYSSKSLHQQKELKGEATQNSQQFLQKQRTQERKSSLIKPDNPQINQNKNQNVINLQKLNQHTQQLEKIIQSAGNNIITLAQDSKFSNSSSKEALRQSNNSQKMAKKFDSKSINNLTKNNSLTLTQDTSNVNSNNMNSVYSTQQTFLKKSTSNTQKQNNQNNYINLTNKSSDGGHIVMYQINSKKQ